MKDVIKGITVKIISIVIIVVLLLGGGYFAYRHLKGGIVNESSHEVVSNIEIIKEKLEATAELNTGSYLCTDVITKADSKKFKEWKIPFTEKSFIVQYDGIVKAGIKDLAKSKITEEGKTVIVKLPQVEITGIEIDNNSFKKLDESNNIFNPISIEDLNNAQKDLKEKMYERALEKGVLDIARSNAETVLSEMLSSSSGEYNLKIEWETDEETN